jgi:ribose transport system ATP-binding protein
MAESRDYILSIRNISMKFPGVLALSDINLDIVRGETLGLCGENGAGKSTLIKILTGVYKQTNGSFSINGKECHITSPLQAQRLGLSVVHQEIKLVDSLSIMENIFLGRPQTSGGLVSWGKMKKEAKALLGALGLDLNPEVAVGTLSIAQQQIVEICKALAFKSKLIIMDEPSATLTRNEMDLLYDIIAKLKASGMTIVYISHRLEEVFNICDRVAVLRDGELVHLDKIENLDRNILIKHMVGRELGQEFPEPIGASEEEVLRVENLNSPGVLYDINLTLHKGEILGIGGLVGAGRTETARAIIGLDPHAVCDIYVHGEKVRIKHPLDAMKYKMGMLSENRKDEGLVLVMSVAQNISLTNLDSISNGVGLLSYSKERTLANSYIDSLDIRTPNAEKITLELSGGNQQKVIIAKWLNTDAEILIFDEPTRGIDVGAKKEIYNIMHDLTKAGKSIIMITSEMPELIGVSDRILVMADGRITGELKRAETTQEKVLELAIAQKVG